MHLQYTHVVILLKCNLQSSSPPNRLFVFYSGSVDVSEEFWCLEKSGFKKKMQGLQFLVLPLKLLQTYPNSQIDGMSSTTTICLIELCFKVLHQEVLPFDQWIVNNR
jgi:hypothetical protein